MDPYVHVICEKTKRLGCMPGEGFAQRISVTVGVALLVEWAARKTTGSTAARVLQQLISGTVGSKQDWEKVRNRLQTVTGKIKKDIKKNEEAAFTSESVHARLSSPFRLPQGGRYPQLLKVARQAKEAHCPTPGEKPACSLLLPHPWRTLHDDDSNVACPFVSTGSGGRGQRGGGSGGRE